MPELGLIAAAIVLAAAPHLLPQRSLAPAVGICLWFGALLFRAAAMVAAAAAMLFIAPATWQFASVSDWCLHTVVPYLSAHLGLDGHAFAHFAVFLPALGLLIALVSVTANLVRTTRRLLRWVEARSLGPGPEGSRIVAGADVVLATAGLVRPRMLVSVGALLSLSERELRAGIEHERGHLRRGHRFVSAASVALHGCAKPLPGSKRAFDRLHFHLERDADEYARRVTHDPAGLASAIAAAAGTSPVSSAGAVAFGIAGASVEARIEALTAASPRRRGLAVAGGILGVASVAGAVAALAVVPVLILTGTVDAQMPLAELFRC